MELYIELKDHEVIEVVEIKRLSRTQQILRGVLKGEGTVVCKMYLTAVSFPSISQDILKVSKHAIYHKEAL